MSPPWMPLYVRDYLSDTCHLTTVQHGAYLLLIMYYWKIGMLPSDEKQLCSIARLTLDKWKAISPQIQQFFEIGSEGRWIHRRIEKELSAARKKYEKRANAGRLGGIETAKKNSSNAAASEAANEQHPYTNHKHNHKEEEKKQTPPRERAKKLSEEFSLSETDIKFCRDREWDDSRIQSEFERFRDHALANGRCQINWHAAWRNWVTSPYQTKGHANGNGKTRSVQQAVGQLHEQVASKLSQWDELFGSSSDGSSEDTPRLLPPR